MYLVVFDDLSRLPSRKRCPANLFVDGPDDVVHQFCQSPEGFGDGIFGHGIFKTSAGDAAHVARADTQAANPVDVGFRRNFLQQTMVGFFAHRLLGNNSVYFPALAAGVFHEFERSLHTAEAGGRKFVDNHQ